MSKPSPTPATAREPDVRYLRTTQPVATLVDSSILIDVLANDARWADWSLDQLARLGSQGALVINPIILAEVGPRFEGAADLEAASRRLTGRPGRAARRPPTSPRSSAARACRPRRRGTGA